MEQYDIIAQFYDEIMGDQEEVAAYFARPFPAIITILALVVGIFHLMNEAIAAVEDYVHGMAGKLAIVAVTAVSYLLMAAGVFAVAKMAL